MPFSRNQVLIAARETTYGTDAAPTGTANAIQAQAVSVVPMQADLRDRGLVVPFMGAQSAFVANRRVRLEFEVELTGSGAAGTAPGYGPLVRACGFAQTVTAGTQVDYDPVSSGFDSATLHFNLDGRRHRGWGWRGGLGLRYRAGELPKFLFAGEALDAGGPDSFALPTPTFTGFAAPLAVSRANTPAFTLGGTALVLRSLEIQPFDVTYRNRVNSETVEITDHPFVGTMVVDSVALATFDPFAAARNRTQSVLQLTHGTAAGNIVELQAQRAELGPPTLGDDDGIETWSIPFRLVPAAGSAELKLRVR